MSSSSTQRPTLGQVMSELETILDNKESVIVANITLVDGNLKLITNAYLKLDKFSNAIALQRYEALVEKVANFAAAIPQVNEQQQKQMEELQERLNQAETHIAQQKSQLQRNVQRFDENIDATYPVGTIFHVWKFNNSDKELRLVRGANNLRYELIDKLTDEEISSDSIEIGVRSCEEAARMIIRNAVPYVRNDGAVIFKKKILPNQVQVIENDYSEWKTIYNWKNSELKYIIELQMKSNELRYVLIDSNLGVVLSLNKIQIRSGSCESVAARIIKEAIPDINDDGTVIFRKKEDVSSQNEDFSDMEIIHSWKINDKEIYLLYTKDKLAYQIFNHETGTPEYTNEIDIGTHTSDEVAHRIMRMQPEITENGVEFQEVFRNSEIDYKSDEEDTPTIEFIKLPIVSRNADLSEDEYKQPVEPPGNHPIQTTPTPSPAPASLGSRFFQYAASKVASVVSYATDKITSTISSTTDKVALAIEDTTNRIGASASSTIATVSQSIQEEIRKSETHLIYKWRVDNNEIHLIKKDNDLSIIVYRAEINFFRNERQFHEITRQDLATCENDEEMQEQITQVLEHEPLINSNGSIELLKPYRSWMIGDLDSSDEFDRKNKNLLNPNNELRLFIRSDSLIFQYLDKSTGLRYNYKPYNNESFTDEISYFKFRCYCKSKLHFELKTLPKMLREQTIDFNTLELDDFEVKHIEVKMYNNFSILHLGVEPRITIPSHIDSRMLLNKFTWGVTLVRYKNPERPESQGQHAELVIEGIANSPQFGGDDLVRIGEYFMIVADFDGVTDTPKSIDSTSKAIEKITSGKINLNLPVSSRSSGGKKTEGRVRVINLSKKPEKLLYIDRSRLWAVSSEKVLKMFDVIMSQNLKTIPRPKLNLLGRDSIFARNDEDNCLTWAKEKLAILGITFPRPALGANLVSLTSSYMHPESFHEYNHPIYVSPRFNYEER